MPDILVTTQDGIGVVSLNRPEVRNAFRPETITELQHAFTDVRDDADVGVVILTGQGRDAFCSGGDQRVKMRGGYQREEGTHALNVLELQKAIRSLPVPVIALVNGFAIGGGHVLHVLCDVTIAADHAPRVGHWSKNVGLRPVALPQ